MWAKVILKERSIEDVRPIHRLPKKKNWDDVKNSREETLATLFLKNNKTNVLKKTLTEQIEEFIQNILWFS